MAAAPEARPRTIFCVDIAGFTDRGRTDWDRRAAHEGLYAALRYAFEQVKVPFRRWRPVRRWVPWSGWPAPWVACEWQDRGDGTLILVPPGIPKNRLVARLPQILAEALARYNETCPPHAAFQLRAAVGAVEVIKRGRGFIGQSVNDTFRLLDAREFKEMLRESGAVLGLITSVWFFDNVVRQDPANDGELYKRLEVSTNNGPSVAYVRLFTGDSADTGVGPEGHGRKRGRAARRLGGGSALILLAAMIVTAAAVLAGEAPADRCDEPPAQVRILPSVEKEALVRSLAHDFEIGYLDAEGCRKADLRVASVPYRGGAAEALDQGWLRQDLGETSNEADVWLPDSSLEVAQVREVLRKSRMGTITLRAGPSIAQSPLVAAVPEEMAGKLDQPFAWRKASSWSRQGYFFGRAAPRTSSAGLIATAALYRGALGAEVLDDKALTGQDAARRLHGIENGIVQADDDPANLLCALRRSPAGSRPRRTALLISEKAAADYRKGVPLGTRCGAVSPSTTPELIPLYAEEGTPVLDHPYVVIERDALPRSPARRQAIDDFLTYLRQPTTQWQVRNAGYRDFAGNGAHEDEVFTDRPRVMDLAGAVRDEPLLEAWDKARRSAQVLFAVDVSRAMAAAFPYVRETRLAAAAEAIGLSSQLIGDRDEVGLWEFARQGGGPGHRQLLGLAPAGRDRLQQLEEKLAGMAPTGGGSTLFATIRAAAEHLRASPGADEAIKAVVVVADGADTASQGPSGAELADELRSGEPIRVYVLAFRAEGCATWLDEITRDTGGTCYEIDSMTTMRRALDGIASGLWGKPR